MAKAFSNDLRRRILQAYAQRQGTMVQLAASFHVSLGYVKKILRQKRCTGKMDRVPHRPGRKPRFTLPIREQMRAWLKSQPDLTLVELQEKLRQQAHLQVSLPSIWVVLKKKMGLRLKKSRSTPRSKTRPRSNSSAKRFS
jgi:transposase